MSEQPVVSLQDVTVRFGENLALDRIAFEIDPQEIVSVVGPNGSGKTTLVHTILGLIEPSEGTVRVFGTDPRKALRSRRIGYLPQDTGTDSRFPVSAFDVAAMPVPGHRKPFGFLTGSDRKRVIEALRRVGMEEAAHFHFGRLSGGQKQRVLIARALALEPRLLVLDEPSTGLDVVSQESFYRLLQSLRDEEGFTILFVSHDIGAVSGIVDRIACLNRKIHFHGRPSDCVPSEALERVFGKDVQFVYHDRNCHTCEGDK